MLGTIALLARLAATPPGQVREDTVLSACGLVRRILGAEDAYVIRSGDPHFVRLGSNDDPREYEIKQRGYWLIWREGATQPGSLGSLFSVTDRMVTDPQPLETGVPATHLATTLPGNESNSEVLVIRGPWPGGITVAEVELIATIRPLMAYLMGNYLDGERQERQRSQLNALAEVADAFRTSTDVNQALTGLATALAKASGYAWVSITLNDPAIENITDRALNLSRHSGTHIAEQGRDGTIGPSALERDIRVARHVAWTGKPYLVPDVFAPAEQMLVDDSLRDYYAAAHILSMACFPLFFREQLIGSITFSASESRSFEEQEMAFLTALVAQASNTVTALRLNRELRETEAQLRAVFANSPALITVIERDGTISLSEGAILHGNNAGEGSVFGASQAAVGSRAEALVPPAYAGAITEAIRRCLNGETFSTQMHIAGRDHETRFAPLRDDSGVPVSVIAIGTDITERVAAEHELRTLNEALRTAKERAEGLARAAEASRRRAEFLASHDGLTGVLSRRAWFQLAESRRASAVAIFDIDFFKAVNDTHGHPAGDVVLKAVADCLVRSVGDAGTVGRLGGEEFAVLFEGTRAEAEEAAAQAVATVAATPIQLPGGKTLSVSISAGLAPCRRQSDTSAAAVARAYELADQALYSAKTGGRRQLVISAKAA